MSDALVYRCMLIDTRGDEPVCIGEAHVVLDFGEYQTRAIACMCRLDDAERVFRSQIDRVKPNFVFREWHQVAVFYRPVNLDYSAMKLSVDTVSRLVAWGLIKTGDRVGLVGEGDVFTVIVR